MGVAVGCAAGAVGAMFAQKHKKGLKKTLGKAVRNVGSMMDEVNGIF